MDNSMYTHTGTSTAESTANTVRGFPASPATACISSQAPTPHMPHTRTMVAHSGATPSTKIKNGMPTTATITRLNIRSAL